MKTFRQMPRGRRRLAALFFLLLVIIVIGIVWLLLREEEEEKPLGKDEAAEIIVTEVAEPLWRDGDQTKGLRVNLYGELLTAGTRVQPALPLGEGEPVELVCENQCWLFFIDEFPDAHFGHPVQIILLDAETKDRQVIQAEWWPQIDGESVFDKLDARADPDTIIFYEAPVFDMESVPLETPPPLNQMHGPCVPGEACEIWAIIVCGFDDLPDTFDEDTDGMYSVLRNASVPDDHIFFLSPHTDHAGVDRATSIVNVQWAIDQVAAQSDQSDWVLFFYSSHGGINSLSCVPGSPDGGSILAADLDNWLDAITSEELTIVIEACHSGSLIGLYADGTYVAAEDDLTGDGETNRVVFTSASTDTSSSADVDGPDDPNIGDIGSETIWGYVEAFDTAIADANSNGDISFGEAWQYAWDNDVTRIRGWNTPQMVHTGLVIDDVYNYCPCPDLVVASLSHDPASPTTNDAITFTAVVENIGVGPAGPVTLSFKVGGETTPATYSIPALDPGETYTVERTETLSVAQNYLNTVIVDVDNDVAESNEANNEETDSYAVTPAAGADLIIESLSHDPASPTTTDAITFTAVVKNVGSDPSGPCTLSFKVGGETTPATYSIPALDPGETHTVERTETLSVAQNYLNTVIVDVDNDVAESNEANNEETDAYRVTEP